MNCRLLLTTLFLLLTLPTVAKANWLLFDLQGDVKLTSGGKTTGLNAAKHLLMEIAAGSSLTTGAKSQAVLVSMITNDAFEIGADAAVKIEEKALTAGKGKVEQRKGYALPKKKSNLMAGVVMRGDRPAECLRPLRGANTAVHSLTPTLKWQNQCNDSPVRVSLFADRGLLLEQESRSGELTVPAGQLQHGQRYVWLVETANRDQGAAATFTVLAADEAARVGCLLDVNCSGHTGFAARLSDIFYLTEHNLNDLADEQVATLAAERPDLDLSQLLQR
jgi:hypothetical protein